MPFSFQHLTSTYQFLRDDVSHILDVSRAMEHVLESGGDDRLYGKILANLFYEPSTRTHLSFATAMHRLGGQVISTESVQFSSLYKGETIEDTIMVVGQYADIICMRHPQIGSADRAAAISPVPFINAGDGPGQHPTQALLDLYTIQKERGQVDDLHIAMIGDLKYGRTVHSLSVLLGLYNNIRYTFVSPDELRMPADIKDTLHKKNIHFEESQNLESGLSADVIYMTRIQKERFDDLEEYERLKEIYTLHAKHIKGKTATVMHPLPRVGEIDISVDALSNAAYFREVRNGIIVRMALLAIMLGKE